MNERNRCQEIQPLLSEYVDGTIEPARNLFAVQSHIAVCDDCRHVTLEMRSLSRILRGLPRETTSSDFEHKLMARIAEQPARRSWFPAFPQNFSERFRLCWAIAGAGALVAALTVFGFIVSVPPSTDQPLVVHCIVQHQAYMAQQPLGDWAAQNLAGKVEGHAGTPSTMPDDTGNL